MMLPTRSASMAASKKKSKCIGLPERKTHVWIDRIDGTATKESWLRKTHTNFSANYRWRRLCKTTDGEVSSLNSNVGESTSRWLQGLRQLSQLERVNQWD